MVMASGPRLGPYGIMEPHAPPATAERCPIADASVARGALCWVQPAAARQVAVISPHHDSTAACGRFIRRSRSWKRGSERKGS
jgi:hypothetical protein